MHICFLVTATQSHKTHKHQQKHKHTQTHTHARTCTGSSTCILVPFVHASKYDNWYFSITLTSQQNLNLPASFHDHVTNIKYMPSHCSPGLAGCPCVFTAAWVVHYLSWLTRENNEHQCSALSRNARASATNQREQLPSPLNQPRKFTQVHRWHGEGMHLFFEFRVSSCLLVSAKPGSSRICICNRHRSRKICVLSLSRFRACL